MEKKGLEYLRDCVKEALNNGCERGQEFRKMRHAIIVEMQRLRFDSAEIKDKLRQWNSVCEKPLGESEQKIKLDGYVDWVFKHDCRLSCKALEDYCISKDNCQFYKRTILRNRQITQELPFNIEELEKFLTERFKAEGYGMMLVVEALRLIQYEKATGEIILVGLRTIGSVIRDKYNHEFSHMDVSRKIALLEEEGVLELAIRGKPGTFSNQANGYRFLPWKPPYPPILTDMCNKQKSGDTQ